MAEKKDAPAKKVLGGKSKKAKKAVHKMHIRHAANGGFIAEHEHAPSNQGEPPEPNEEHVLPDIASLQQHVGENMAQAPEQAEPASAAPMAA